MEGHLWALDRAGVPQKLSPESAEWTAVPLLAHDGNVLRVLKICATPSSILALDKYGCIHLYLCMGHLSVRVVVDTFENQRWYPGLGWSTHTLPTDRWAYSNRDGTEPLPFESFDMPSEGWRWEVPWMVDTPPKGSDKQGWEYAFNFGMVFKPTCSATSLVRRRRWTRSRRYTEVNRWMQYPTDPTDGGFLDFAAGGFDLKSPNNKGEYSLFALHRRGSLAIRKGIRSNSSPEGTHWLVVDDIPSEENNGDVEQISKITCSHSYGNLIAITWDGRLFYRSGITADRREGAAWSKIELPVLAPVVDICLGRNALWMSSANGTLWFRKVINRTIGAHYELNTKTPESYVKMGDRMCRVAVSRDDRVLAIDKSNEKLFLRSNVTTNELSGRQWIEIVATGNKENIEWNQVDFGSLHLSESGFPRLWTDPNFVKQSQNAVSDRHSEWRAQILERLDTLADKVWNTSRDHPCPYERAGRSLSIDGMSEESSQWVLKATVQVVVFPSKNQSRKAGKATLAMSSFSEGYLCVDYRDKTHFKASFKQILCVCSTGLLNGKPSLRILLSGDSKSSKEITLDFSFDSEDEREKWKTQMQKIVLALVQSEPRSIDKRCMWFVDSQGSPRVGFLSTLQIGQQPEKVELIPLAKCRWLQLPGHFTAVSSSNGLVYAVSSDGELWSLSRDFDLMREIDVDIDLAQTDTVTEIIYEHEKKSRLSGFCTFNGRANGLFFAWSDKTGLVQKRKEDCRLPSREWSWVDPEWLLVPAPEGSKDPESGWIYARSFGEEFNKADGWVRRREWRRRRHFSSKAPWVRIDAPPIAHVKIQNDRSWPLFLWVLSIDGDLLCRTGISSSNPNGSAWMEIVCNEPLARIAPAWNCCIWALTTSARILCRHATDIADMFTCDWAEVDSPVEVNTPESHPIAITATGAAVWVVLNDDPSILYQRLGISLTNPEGTSWMRVKSPLEIASLATSASGYLYAVLINKQTLLPMTAVLKDILTEVPKKKKVKGKQSDVEADKVAVWEFGISSQQINSLAVD
ncbi:hypothetical protein QR680_000432 [Steinernema hermaphroditum]|uniref:Peroxin/Ferlin domain-containing protein n=1 Tax=Steinernema hermaphroditum TaxID=289476 RepID=A0AA39GXD1_9BILA|nr:hypothetical protein QR680_000432 [Steinernema hermaphroditum]